MDIMGKLQAGMLSSSPEQTEQIGASVAGILQEDVALALSGELGTGKTTFVRGLARGLGIKAAVTSPTYNIYTTYEGKRQLFHMDAFRLESSIGLANLGIEDVLRTPFLIAVEWPENIPGFFDDYTSFWIRLEILEDHRHRIRLLDRRG